jgi:hypothetical protein
MKKIKAPLIIIGLSIATYQSLNYLVRVLLVVGTPVTVHNINESKAFKVFICEYKPLECNEYLFDKVWLEKKAYWLIEGVRTVNVYILRFSFKEKANVKTSHESSDYTDIITNFEYGGFGKDNNGREPIFDIFVRNNISDKDTLRISFLHKKKRINKILVKAQSISVSSSL